MSSSEIRMVTAPPRGSLAIDRYPWVRAAAAFANMSVEEHEATASRLGSKAAAEVLVLTIDTKCGGSKRKWEMAKDLGIQWQHNT